MVTTTAIDPSMPQIRSVGTAADGQQAVEPDSAAALVGPHAVATGDAAGHRWSVTAHVDRHQKGSKLVAEPKSR